jgi:hypothetical protein
MSFTFAAFTYIVALIVDAFLIFFAIFHVSFYNSKKVDAKIGLIWTVVMTQTPPADNRLR